MKLYTCKDLAKEAGFCESHILYLCRKNNFSKTKNNRRFCYLLNEKEAEIILNYCNRPKNTKKEKFIAVLKEAGEKGISREDVRKLLKINDIQLSTLLLGITTEPVAYDRRIDDKFYWVGR